MTDRPNPYKAHIAVDYAGRFGHVLYLARDAGDGMDSLYEDGSFYTRPYDAHGAPQANGATEGLRLDDDALDAVLEALMAWKGDRSHAATEARILRESLDYERGQRENLLSVLIEHALAPPLTIVGQDPAARLQTLREMVKVEPPLCKTHECGHPESDHAALGCVRCACAGFRAWL